jgi:glycosyltransferase involved in cell wall biosynthesis
LAEITMKVLHLQYYSTSSGNYTKTLHDLMKEHGIDSSVLSLIINFTPDDNKIESLGKHQAFYSGLEYKLQNYLNRNNNTQFGGFTFPFFGADIRGHHLVKEADVIYVHWVLYGFLNTQRLMQLARIGKPLVFVLHDMWFLTGGCHYSFACEKFKSACHNCQILPPPKLIDRASLGFKKKSKFYNTFKNISFIAPSVWMKENADNSTLLKGKRIYQVYNSVSKKFQKLQTNSFREENNIDEGKKIIGFGANYINSPYKGFAFLLAALKILGKMDETENMEILVFGSNLSETIINEIPFKVHYTGYLNTEEAICKAYNAMDVFVVSSIADNLPTTVLESLTCGTPVVGFKTGGIPEMVVHKKNGYLAEKNDVTDLCNGIKYCVENKIQGYLSNDFSAEEIMNSHFSILKEVIALEVDA